MTAVWDELHTRPRHQLSYPSEPVVRFLARHEPSGRAVDIGSGSGRHAALMAEKGWLVEACDGSLEAMLLTRRVMRGGDSRRAPMTALPYPDELFRLAVAYGVFYYGTPADMRQAISELHRVLRPGGSALVTLRSNRDYRKRYVRRGRLVLPGEPEDGMRMTFVPEAEIPALFHQFAALEVGLTETTWADRRASEWLIEVTK